MNQDFLTRIREVEQHIRELEEFYNTIKAKEGEINNLLLEVISFLKSIIEKIYRLCEQYDKFKFEVNRRIMLYAPTTFKGLILEEEYQSLSDYVRWVENYKKLVELEVQAILINRSRKDSYSIEIDCKTCYGARDYIIIPIDEKLPIAAKLIIFENFEHILDIIKLVIEAFKNELSMLNDIFNKIENVCICIRHEAERFRTANSNRSIHNRVTAASRD
ncbi:MAG: hypothetical protein GXO26_07360 [Crenarchaeota archaeon]|nr:hypothetical protein [Thermoproteota archaeon]